ncbi:MAG: UDP-N-acetylglucosamine 1-carboxyvinyltransferase [Deltaproteobacteria bacterium]|nr:UDP-N-acetylglucosamine 1-carboxyvinyltransferase [Deltaproteobacteria bacterium]
MEKIIIKGGKPLCGKVKIGGAKNAALPLISSSILLDGRCEFSNVPQLRDVETICKLLELMGAKFELKQHNLKIDASNINKTFAPYDLVKTMRASILVLGPLLAKYKKARVSLPGGCAIGERPVNLHIEALRKLGALIEVKNGYIEAKAKKLKGREIYFDIPTVTGTENVVMAATLADGITTILNAAQEPEVVDLANFLNGCGAKIEGAGTENIVVSGVSSLKANKVHNIIFDRVEAGTYMVLACATKGDVEIIDAPYSHLHAVVEKLEDVGASINVKENGLRVKMKGKIKHTDIKTMPYPGFPTDMQAQFTSLLSIADGNSVITETIFEKRFSHVPELVRMGANIRVSGNHAIIEGVDHLNGAPVTATDLRAAASLIIAGLVARGETTMFGVHHLDRGYENLEQKISALSGFIRREKSE